MKTAEKKRNIKKDSQNAGGASRKEASSAISPADKLSNYPNVFHYHDYLKFLVDWVSYHKKNVRGFSVRKLAEQSGVSVGYLPMVLAKQRPLSTEMLYKIMPHLGLSRSQQQFFRSMHTLGTTSSQEVRIESIRQMKRFAAFRKNNPNEDEVSKYLTQWHYSAIREMAADPDFKPDPLHIQERLRFRIPLVEIKEALAFLIEKKYIQLTKTGQVVPPEKHIECDGGIYKIALTQYHQQFLDLAAKSIAEIPSEERQLTGHTFAISADKFEEVRSLISGVVERIQALSSEPKEIHKQVYHIEMSLIPLTKKKENSNE